MMNARLLFSLLFSVLLPLSMVASAQTLTVDGAADSQQQYTLDSESLLEILASGNVFARVNDDVSCGACDSCCEPCDSCAPCEPCECSCDTQLQFNQFSVSSGGTSVGAGSQLTITQGDTVQVRWQTPGAFTCTGSGLSGTSWNGAQPTYSALSGSAGVNVLTGPLDPDASPYTLSLTCDNASRQEQQQVTLLVEAQSDPDPTPTACVGVPSLQQASGGTIVRAQDILLDMEKDGFLFAEVFRDPFPGRRGMQSRMRHFPNNYASMHFRTPANLNASHDGRLAKEVLLGTQGGPAIMSISRCEGDFDINSVDAGCYRKVEGHDSLNWTGNPDIWYDCSLEPDTEYYFNIVYTLAPSGTPPAQIEWNCAGDDNSTRCGHLYTPSYNYSHSD